MHNKTIVGVEQNMHDHLTRHAYNSIYQFVAMTCMHSIMNY